VKPPDAAGYLLTGCRQPVGGLGRRRGSAGRWRGRPGLHRDRAQCRTAIV